MEENGEWQNEHLVCWYLKYPNKCIGLNKSIHWQAIISYTHSKSHCSANYINFIFAPLLLNEGALGRIHATVIKGCFMSTFLKINWLKLDLHISITIVNFKKHITTTHFVKAKWGSISFFGCVEVSLANFKFNVCVKAKYP